MQVDTFVRSFQPWLENLLLADMVQIVLSFYGRGTIGVLHIPEWTELDPSNCSFQWYANHELLELTLNIHVHEDEKMELVLFDGVARSERTVLHSDRRNPNSQIVRGKQALQRVYSGKKIGPFLSHDVGYAWQTQQHIIFRIDVSIFTDECFKCHKKCNDGFYPCTVWREGIRGMVICDTCQIGTFSRCFICHAAGPIINLSGVSVQKLWPEFHAWEGTKFVACEQCCTFYGLHKGSTLKKVEELRNKYNWQYGLPLIVS